ncbi:MAG: hypothetical protein KME42_25070 [Tildeniella nuda ZEHNDER 1965/U140]|jgi:CRISPR-associated protein Cmr2|nr:hypothetical protein [Tildeniella nuda ZEHNDER 1965/U140]
MTEIITAITFAPVQGFIEKSRKLRDLYGSSFILSYLANAVCQAARKHLNPTNEPIKPAILGYPVISPALISQTQGTPNQLVIAGEFPEQAAKDAFNDAWKVIMQTCQGWIEQEVKTSDGKQFDYCWRRDWSLWTRHAWEFFWATGTTIAEARQHLNEVKRSRAWIGINWTGESSSLSGADTIAYPGMSRKVNPKHRNHRAEETEIQAFYHCLSERVQEAMITPREQLSIPELVKRLVTVAEITDRLPAIEPPGSFRALNRWQDDDLPEGMEPEEVDRQEAKRWTGWFQGDGDQAGTYLQTLDAEGLNRFSQNMRKWGKKLKNALPKPSKTRRTLDRDGRIVYAGGDDFLGVLFRNPPDEPLTPKDCLEQFFYRFKSDTWNSHGEPINVSVGFVWAAPNVPQREVLQHCREAEQSAKSRGRDRLALRILFNSGTHLEWVCPWRFLPVLQDYRDRGREQNWTHVYNDVAVLDARHAFEGNQAEVAIGLLRVYFKPKNNPDNGYWKDDDQEQFYHLMNAATLDFNQDGWWNLYEGDDRFDSHGNRTLTGILGNRQPYLKDNTTELDEPKVIHALNDWIINLAKVGFHLCSNS